MEPAREAPAETGGPRPRRHVWLALVLLGIVAGLFAAGRHVVTPAHVFGHYDVLRGVVDRHPVLALAGYVAVYVAFVALSLPGSVMFTALGGLLFGGPVGGAAALLSASSGAVILFVVARRAARAVVPPGARARIDRLVSAIGSDAAGVLLAIRFAPIIPFWLANLAAAIVGVPLRLFAATTLAGMLPATFAFAFAGAALDGIIAERRDAWLACRAARSGPCGFDLSLHSVLTPHLLAALSLLALLALLPVAMRRLGIVPFSRPPRAGTASGADAAGGLRGGDDHS